MGWGSIEFIVVSSRRQLPPASIGGGGTHVIQTMGNVAHAPLILYAINAGPSGITWRDLREYSHEIREILPRSGHLRFFLSGAASQYIIFGIPFLLFISGVTREKLMGF